MFSSRTLDERNNDPKPYLWESGGRTDAPSRWGGSRDGRYMPRREYQYGKLPANPILVALRDGQWLLGRKILGTVGLATAYLADPMTGWGTPEEIAHARRVLTLLVTQSLSLSTR